MGRDIQALIGHGLDTSSIGQLAEDLTRYLGINVVFGYNHMPKSLADLYNPAGAGLEEGVWVELGRTGEWADKDYFVLFDMDFVERELFLRHGKAILATEAYTEYHGNDLKHNLNRMMTETVHPHYWLDHADYENIYLHIQKGNVECHLWGTQDTCEFTYWRWHALYYQIMGHETWWNHTEPLTMFRTLHLQLAHQLGGDKVYYTDDQCTTLGEHYIWSMEWDEMENYIRNTAGDCLGDVPSLLALDAARKNEMDMIAFVDDGRDLLPGIDLKGRIWYEMIPRDGDGEVPFKP